MKQTWRVNKLAVDFACNLSFFYFSMSITTMEWWAQSIAVVQLLWICLIYPWTCIFSLPLPPSKGSKGRLYMQAHGYTTKELQWDYSLMQQTFTIVLLPSLTIKNQWLCSSAMLCILQFAVCLSLAPGDCPHIVACMYVCLYLFESMQACHTHKTTPPPQTTKTLTNRQSLTANHTILFPLF